MNASLMNIKILSTSFNPFVSVVFHFVFTQRTSLLISARTVYIEAVYARNIVCEFYANFIPLDLTPCSKQIHK